MILSSRAVCHRHHPPPPLPSLLTENTLRAPTFVGGTAGCVIASRLATAGPDLRILVLEAGPTTHNDPAHRHPTRYMTHLAPDSRTARAHVGRPSAALGGRSTIVHTGQCLGGGGSVNRTSISKSPLLPHMASVRRYFRNGKERKKG